MLRMAPAVSSRIRPFGRGSRRLCWKRAEQGSEDRGRRLTWADHDDRLTRASSEVASEDVVPDRVARRIGDDAGDRAEMLLDVHRDPLPGVRIAGIGTESHRARGLVVEAPGHDA